MSTRIHWRTLALLAALLMALSVIAAIPAQATPGVPPDITSTTTKVLDPGTSAFVRINATGVDSPATVTFTGTGVTGTITTYGSARIRISITADASAEAGFRDMTITNPDGLSDTMLNAVQVTGDIPPPATGDLTGHVFEDTNGNGALDGGEAGLEGVSVNVTDSMGNGHGVSTNVDGNFTVLDVPTGDATVAYTTPGGYALTTANGSQTVTITVDTSVAAADVGYEPVPTGDLSGRVFTDIDGNGIEDGGDSGWAGASVTVTDAGGAVFAVMTDSNGDFNAVNLEPGDASVVYTTPSGATLTTGNASQTVTIVDGTSMAAAAVGYEPPAGVAPDITTITGNSTIDPGASKYLKVTVLNYQAGATFTVSGTGVTATIAKVGGTLIRILVAADATAPGGVRDLTVTNPDGLSDTAVGAITITGGTPPTDTGTVAGHVFQDLNGDGIENGADTGFAGVPVAFTVGGTTTNGATNGTGDFSMVVGVGSGTLTVSAPAGFAVSSGNGSQSLSIVKDATTTAAAVGLETAGLTYQNVAGAAGITTDHSAAGLCSPPIGIGSAWADVDNDGDQDLYTSNRAGGNHLYLNNGDTTGDGTPDFTDVGASLGIDHAGLDSFGVAFADIDNDGDQDLYVGDETGNKLWENQFANNGGTLAFVNVTASAGVADNGRAQTIAFGDFDNDGWLDFYVTKHMNCNGGTPTDALFHGDGDGTFTNWTTYLCDGGDPSTCDDVRGLGFAAAFLDVDQDGDDDLYVVNDNIEGINQPNKMFRNDGSDGSGGWLFTEVGQTDGSGLSVNGMGLGWGDYNNDGWLDLAFSDNAPGHLIANDGDGTYTDVSTSSQVQAQTAGAVGWGTALYDYNNDGWQDILFAHGGINDVTQPYPNALLENDKDGTFTNVAAATGMDDDRRGRGIALADFNDDGWVDVFMANYDDAPLLMQNMSADNGATNGWLTVTVEGTESNRDGLGTEMVLTTSHGTQRQVITSGPNHGSGSQKAAFFGLGADTTGDLVVYWPNGQVQNMGPVGANQAMHLIEPATPPPSDGLFDDVTNRAGVSLVHVEDGCGPPIGVGAAWGDYDNDGDQDLYVTNQVGVNHLYRNDGDTSGDGTVDLANVAASLGVDMPSVRSYATVFVDVDNDGDQDLFVASDSGNKLFRNDLIGLGSVGFTDISGTSGITDIGRINTATFGDIDNDGNLDLYVAKHMTCASFGDNFDHLYHGNGDGTFTDWTTYLCGGGADPCDDTSGLGFAAVMVDYDLDSDLDIYLVNDDILGNNQPNKLWRNDGSDGSGGWVLTEVGAASGAGVSVNGMGAAFGDPDNDGDFDLSYSDASPGHMLQNNNNGTFTDVSGSSGISAATAGDVGWGTVFFDYNNDGWEDLFFATGPISAVSPLANSMLKNEGNAMFTNVSTETNMDNTVKARGVATGDMDGDGWVDLFVSNYDVAPILMHNVSGEQGNANHHLTFTVQGTDSNRDGIGTIIRITTADGTQTRMISSGSNHGGGSQKAAFFGLGSASSATVDVIWPNGEVEALGSMTADAAYHLVEPAA